MVASRSLLLWVFALSLLLSACATGDGAAPTAPPEAVASTAPQLGKADSGDRADRSCQVVLRSAMRHADGPGYETDCSGGDCLYVWRGWVEVDQALAADASVRVLYHRLDDPTWWEVEASEESGAAPGYRRYGFALSEHLFGPGDEGASIELVAFLRDEQGNRLFDHNRFADDFSNTQLEPQSDYFATDGGVCQPLVGTLWFQDDWSETAHGTRRQGGYLEVHYDLDRLPTCRGTHNGHPAWDMVAFVRFMPAGQLVSGSVRRFISNNGIPTNEAEEVALVVPIPEGATSAELWFQNFSGAGSTCEAWDSNYGDNYVFDVWPSLDDPRCKDVEKETGIHTEDDRMAHNQAHCLDYDLAAQYDADHCEIYVEGFGNGHMGHYGIPFHWLVGYLRNGSLEGEILNVGMLARFHDAETGEPGQRYLLGLEEEPGLWRTGFAYRTPAMMGSNGNDDIVDEIAFFIDLRQGNGDVVRLWQSRHGDNYRLDDAFSLPASTEYIPYGNIEWANPAAAIYESRQACQ